jgi:RHS repeat-associated protein
MRPTSSVTNMPLEFHRTTIMLRHFLGRALPDFMRLCLFILATIALPCAIHAGSATATGTFGTVTATWTDLSHPLSVTWNLVAGNGSLYGVVDVDQLDANGNFAARQLQRISTPPGPGPNSGSASLPVPGGNYRLIAQTLEYGTNANKGTIIVPFVYDNPKNPTDDPAVISKWDQSRLDTKGGSVQLATGAEATTRTLFSLVGARDWSFDLSYNSKITPELLSQYEIGYGWTHNFAAHIVSTQGGLVMHWDELSTSTFTGVSGQPGSFISTDDAAQSDKIVFQVDGKFLLTRKDQSTKLFDSSGRLIEDRDSHGRTLFLTYGTSGLATITEPISGTGLTFAYNANGTIATITDVMGHAVSFTYATANGTTTKLISITNQNGKKVVFDYVAGQFHTLTDDAGNVLTTNGLEGHAKVGTQADPYGLYTFVYSTFSTGGTTTMTDRNGKVTTYTFDANGNTISVVDPLSATSSYTYDSHNNLVTAKDPLNRVTTYTYDAVGNLLTVTDPAGKVTTFTYDSQNRLLTTTDAVAQVTTRTYDAHSNILTVTDALNHTTTWTYDSNSLPLTMTLPGGGVFHYTYTAGRLTEATDPNGVVSRFGYDANGKVLYREDALGKRTAFTYDAIGNLLTTTNALNQTTTLAYDYRNRVVSSTDPAGAITTFAYDLNNNLLSITNALGKTTSNTYDPEEHLKTTTDALNRTVTRGYDSDGRMSSITDPANQITKFEYDAAGQLTALVDALGKRTVSAYDVRALLTSVTDPLSRVSQFSYDDLGRRKDATDPLNRKTLYAYDALNRLKQVSDPASLNAVQQFDVDGNRTSLTNPAANATAFSYDVGGRPTGTTTPEGHASSITYDSRGLVAASTTAPSGSISTFTYDDAARLSSITDSVAAVAFARDSVGRVTTVTENSKTLTRVYDALGRLTSYTDGDGNVIGYEYDDVNRLSRLTYPGGKQVSYAYDLAGRLSTVTDWANRVTTYSYDAVGRMTQLLRPNGTKQTRSYDDAGQLLHLKEIGADGTTLIYSGDFNYDLAGQLSTEMLNPSVSPTVSFATQTFDGDNRLLTHNGAAVNFDANGNLLTVAAGLMPSSYTYDARNRVAAAGGLSYTYDAENHRIGLTDATGTTHFAINPNASLDQVLVRTAPDGTKTYYVYGAGLLLEETNSVVRYYHTDRRGDTVALTDGAGTVTDRVSYGVYGEIVSRMGSTNTPFLFNGRWGVQTDASGIYYQRARYYHPGLRRFLNQDMLLGSIEAPLGLNRFSYTNGNPVSSIDPFGLMKEEIAPNNSLCAQKAARLAQARAALMRMRNTTNVANNQLINERNGNITGEVDQAERANYVREQLDRGQNMVDATTELMSGIKEFMESGTIASSAVAGPLSGVSLIGSTYKFGMGIQQIHEGNIYAGSADAGSGVYAFTMTTLNMANQTGSLSAAGGRFLARANPVTLIASIGILDAQIAYTNIKQGGDLEGLVTNSTSTMDALDRGEHAYANLVADYRACGCK